MDFTGVNKAPEIVFKIWCGFGGLRKRSIMEKIVRPLLSGEKVTSLRNFLNNQRVTAQDYGLNLSLFKILRKRRGYKLFHISIFL